jgi:hypothetical protein
MKPIVFRMSTDIVKLILHPITADVRVASLDVSVAPSPNFYRLSATFRFENPSGSEWSPGVLGLRTGNPTLPITGAYGTNVEVRRMISRPQISPWIFLKVGNHKTNDTLAVKLEYEWRPWKRVMDGVVGSLCLSLPDHLHLLASQDPLRSPYITDQPKLRLTIEAQGLSLLRGEVVSRLSNVEPSLGNVSYLSSCLIEAPAGHSSLETYALRPVNISPTMASALTPSEGASVVHIANDATIFLGQLFGTGIPGRLWLVAPREIRYHRQPGAAIMIASPGSRKPYDSTNLVAQIALTWWGVGCRLRGHHWRTYQAALVYYSALVWLHETDKRKAEIESDRWFRGIAQTLYQRIRAKIHLNPDRGRGLPLTLALYDDYRTNGTAQEALGVFLRKHWGQVVHTSLLRNELRRLGVRPI